MNVTRPVLRYHGGKWILAPWIISHFPQHKIYVEPFGGGGSVLLRKERSVCEVYNDLDEDVVNLFRVLRDSAKALALCHLLSLTPFGRLDFRAAYELCDDPIERARRMVVRSFQGFGSGSCNRDYSAGFRAASKQTGRPHPADWANIPECLWLVTERLTLIRFWKMETRSRSFQKRPRSKPLSKQPVVGLSTTASAVAIN